jgi:hypothetical protein
MITLFALVSGSTLYAQDLPHLAGVVYSYDRADYNTQQVNAFVRFPLFANAGGMVSYRYLNIYDHTLQTISGQLFYKYKSWTFFGTGGLYDQGWRYGVGFRHITRHSEQLRTGIGVLYNRQFFGNQLIPFLDVNYEPNEHWTISGLFPIRPKVMYHFDRKLSVGIEVMGEANSYMMEDYYLRTTQWTGLLKFEWIFTPRLQLNAGIGKNVINRYQLFEKDAGTPWTLITIPLGEKITPVQEVDLKGLNAMIGLFLRMNRH